eukprot:1161789-Pelagomonas_calceolata.AAC.6
MLVPWRVCHSTVVKNATVGLASNPCRQLTSTLVLTRRGCAQQHFQKTAQAHRISIFISCKCHSAFRAQP